MVELRLHHIHQKIKHHGTYSTDLGEERSLAQSDPRNVSENDTKREVCSKHVFKTPPSTKPNPLHTKYS